MVLETLTSSLTGGFSGLAGVFNYVLFFGIVGGIFYLIWYFLSYNYKVVINYPKEWNRPAEQDKGRFVKGKNDKSISEFRLLKNKGLWDAPVPEDYKRSFKGFLGILRYEIHFLAGRDGQLQLLPRVTEKSLRDNEIATPVDKKWAESKFTETLNLTQDNNFLDKYGALMISGITLISVFVLFLVLVRELQPLAEAFSGAANTFAEAMKYASQNATQVVS